MLTIFMLMNATKFWLQLPLSGRQQFVAETLGPLLAAHPDVKLTFYDAEAFSARCSDVAVFETQSLDSYAELIDAMRNTALYTVPYFEIVDIIPTRATDFV